MMDNVDIMKTTYECLQGEVSKTDETTRSRMIGFRKKCGASKEGTYDTCLQPAWN